MNTLLFPRHDSTTRGALLLQLNTFVFLLYSMLFLVLLYLTVLVTAYDYEAIKALGDIVYCEWGFHKLSITLSESGLLLFRAIVYLSFAALALLAWFSKKLRSTLIKEIHILRSEAKEAIGAAKHRLSTLTWKNWLLLLTLFGAITLIKLYFLINYPLHTDETATYDYFVMEGIEAVTGFYPIPNNHIFQNVLNWIGYQVNPDFYFSVRGTSYLIGTLGLLILFFLLYFITNFRTAVAFALSIGVSYMPSYLSITGRGYSLLLILAGIGFICTYYIIREGSPYRRLGYFILTFSSILGLYTVPTYLYTFATYIILLLAANLVRKQYSQVLISAGVCGLAGFTTVVLYSPILVITGINALFGNPYVAKDTATKLAKYKDSSAILTRFINYIKSLEGGVVGQDELGYLIFILVALITAGLILSGALSPKKRLLCMLALPAMLLPYMFLILQRGLAPERALLYKSFYFFLLTAVIADTAIGYFVKNRRVATALLGALLMLYAGYEVQLNYTKMKQLEPEEKQRQYIWRQVMQDNPSSMYITDSDYQLFFLHYAKVSGKEISFSSKFEGSKVYDVLIIDPDVILTEQVLQNYRSIYKDDELTVYQKKEALTYRHQSFNIPYFRMQYSALIPSRQLIFLPSS